MRRPGQSQVARDTESVFFPKKERKKNREENEETKNLASTKRNSFRTMQPRIWRKNSSFKSIFSLMARSCHGKSTIKQLFERAASRIIAIPSKHAGV